MNALFAFCTSWGNSLRGYGILALAMNFAAAQAAIGHLSFSQEDPSRPGRIVGAEIFYPAESEGDNTPWLNGTFPLVVVGHGFLMDYEAYENIWEALVPEGYVFALCTNETGAFPNHNNFGLDLRFIASSLQAANALPESDFYQRLNGLSACMGHSMGGGSSVLASAGNDVFACYAGLAPANTNPSAIAAAANATLPALVISGDADAITPPNDHHVPIYNGFASSCKYFLNILEGSHCYFANSGSLCDLGEFNPGDLDRATQQSITQTALLFWFNTWLRNQDELGQMEAWAMENTNTELQSDCQVTALEEASGEIIRAYPNPCHNELFVKTTEEGPFRIIGALGQRFQNSDARRVDETTWQLDTSSLPTGRYLLVFGEGRRLWFVVSR